MNNESIQSNRFGMFFGQLRFQRGLVFGIIIVAALLAFEIFNFSTTDYALTDLLGELNFLGVRWATILSIAFCGIDFAGIARLFTPEDGQDEPGEVWYLFGAWLLAATMNAMLTWWGVSLAVINHETLGSAVIEREMLLRVVPIFVAVLVWLIRVLIIGTFSVAGDRLFSQGDQRFQQVQRPYQQAYPSMPASSAPARSFGNNRMPAPRPVAAAPAPAAMSSRRPMHKPAVEPVTTEPAEPDFGRSNPAPTPSHRPESGHIRPEPTYHPLSMSAPNPKSNNNTGSSSGSRSNSRQLR